MLQEMIQAMELIKPNHASKYRPLLKYAFEMKLIGL
jgi:hypothetical protein